MGRLGASFAAGGVGMPLVGFLFHLGLFAPGFMSPDSVDQLVQAHTGEYVDHHPPLVSALWGWVDAVVTAPLGPVALHLFMIWLGLHLIMRASPLLTSNRRWLVWITFAFYPPVIGIFGAMWKDLFMTGAMLLMVGYWLGWRDRRCAGKPSIAMGTGVLVSCALVIASRHNAFVATFPILLGMALILLPATLGRVRLLAAAASSGVLALTMALVLARVGGSLANPAHVWQLAADWDIVGTLAHSRSEELMQHVRNAKLQQIFHPKALTFERVDHFYDGRGWGRFRLGHPPLLRRTRNPEQLAGLRRLWLHTVTTEPRAYLGHRIQTSSNQLGLTPSNAVAPYFLPNRKRQAQVLRPDEFWQPTELRMGQNLLLRVSNAVNRSTPLFRPIIYLLLSLGVCGLAVLRAHPHRLPICVIAGSGLLNELGIMATAITPDYRYSHWMICASLLSLAILLSVTATLHFSPKTHRAGASVRSRV